jgi:hypothetical protein
MEPLSNPQRCLGNEMTAHLPRCDKPCRHFGYGAAVDSARFEGKTNSGSRRLLQVSRARRGIIEIAPNVGSLHA